MTDTIRLGTCKGCDRPVALREAGDIDPDLLANQREEARWLVNRHMGFAGDTCFGSDKNPSYMFGEPVSLPEPLDIGNADYTYFHERRMPLQDNEQNVAGPLLP